MIPDLSVSFQYPLCTLSVFDRPSSTLTDPLGALFYLSD